MDFYQEVQEAVTKGITKDDLSKLKNKLAKKYNIIKVPTDVEIYLKTGANLKTKPMRTMSGVAPLALMTAPFACPHGKCVYCPGGPNSAFGNVPQSYTGHEPSTMRGKRNNYDPYLIVFNRLEQFIVNGHAPEKTEVIIQGGTFPALPQEYQDDFITYTLKAMNDFGEKFYKPEVDMKTFLDFFELPAEIGSPERTQKLQQKMLLMKGTSTLEKEKERNEKTKIRCVALCIETKPDWCFEKHIDNMLNLGTTRVEMGVQCLREEVMKATHRGHTLEDAKKATKLMKNALLKVGYHMMPGLPGMTKQMDKEDYAELFSNQDYKPDALKIYPTTVMKGTGLYGMWKAGKYQPLNTEDAAEIILEAKKYVPKWCRIMRVQRDIPSTVIDAGPNLTNMRQLVDQKLKQNNQKCKCIRCREPREQQINWEATKLLRENYESSGAKEIFLSYEDTQNDLMLGFCRLRIIKESHRPEIKAGDAGIRELHVYGQAVPIGETGEVQHKGIGKMLLQEAEKIAKQEHNCKKMLVISGIGAREYYYKLGYSKDGPYVSKKLC